MVISLNTRQAYSEIDEILRLLSIEQRNKVPEELRELFSKEKDKDYIKVIDPLIAIREQNLKKETLEIIALLNLQYWCEDEAEKERLRKVYAQNERAYQEMLQTKFNTDDLFKRRKTNIKRDQELINNKEIINYKEPLLKKFFTKILKIFKII